MLRLKFTVFSYTFANGCADFVEFPSLAPCSLPVWFFFSFFSSRFVQFSFQENTEIDANIGVAFYANLPSFHLLCVGMLLLPSLLSFSSLLCGGTSFQQCVCFFPLSLPPPGFSLALSVFEDMCFLDSSICPAPQSSLRSPLSSMFPFFGRIH